MLGKNRLTCRRSARNQLHHSDSYIGHEVSFDLLFLLLSRPTPSGDGYYDGSEEHSNKDCNNRTVQPPRQPHALNLLLHPRFGTWWVAGVVHPVGADRLVFGSGLAIRRRGRPNLIVGSV